MFEGVRGFGTLYAQMLGMRLGGQERGGQRGGRNGVDPEEAVVVMGQVTGWNE